MQLGDAKERKKGCRSASEGKCEGKELQITYVLEKSVVQSPALKLLKLLDYLDKTCAEDVHV